jgi:hypothetical protein
MRIKHLAYEESPTTRWCYWTILFYLFFIALLYMFCVLIFYTSRNSFFLYNQPDPEADDVDYTRLFGMAAVLTAGILLIFALFYFVRCYVS